MKKLSIVIVVLFTTCSLSGQTQWVYEGIFDFPFKFHKTKNNDYVLLHGVDEEHLEYFTVVDSAGNILSNIKSFDEFGDGIDIVLFKDIIELPDSTIAIIAHGGAYDANMFYYTRNSLLKFDKNWQVTKYDMGWDGFYDGIALSDGTYILLNEYNAPIRKVSSIGYGILENQLVGYDCYELANTASDSILLATAQGLLVLDANCNIAHTFPNYKFRRLKTSAQGKVMGVREDSLFLLAPDYSLLARLGFQGSKIEDFAFRGDSVAVLTADDSVHLYTGNLAGFGSFQLADEEGQFDFIAFQSANSLMLCGAEKYGNPAASAGNYASFIKEYALDGNDFGLDHDTGVTQVEQGGEAYISQIFTNPSHSYFKVFFKNTAVTVKNYGGHTVHSVTVRAKNGALKKFFNLDLQPGGEAVLNWDEFSQNFDSYPAGTSFNLCFWTSNPDDRLDSDAENDSYCTSFLVDSREPTPMSHSIQLFPNPASEWVNLEIEVPGAEPCEWSLYNTLGAQIKRFQFDGRRIASQSVSVSDLATGLYFWELLSKGERKGQGKLLIVR